MSKRSLVIGIVLAVSASISLGVFVTLPHTGQRGTSGTAMRLDNETLFASAAPFGHKLAMLSSYNDDEVSIRIGNPSGIDFRSCTVVLSTVDGASLNTTLKSYEVIPQKSYDYFTAELQGKDNQSQAREWLVLECRNPHELATNPMIITTKREYSTGETVTLKGMIGYPHVTVRVLDPERTTYLESKLATDNGFLMFSFLIPDDAKEGVWTVEAGSSDTILGQDFRVVRSG